LQYLSNSCSPAHVRAAGSVCTYVPATGSLALGNIGAGETSVLQIALGVTQAGSFVGVAEVTKANEPDIDSTPGDGVGDDRDDDTVVATQVLASGQIGDFVFDDLNANGVSDAGEPGIGGVTLQLTPLAAGRSATTASGRASVTTAVTNAAGLYLFSALETGTYEVRVVSGVPTGFNPTTATFAVVTLATEGQSYLAADFGYAKETLPKTGSDTDQMVLLALLLLLLGLALVLAAARPSRALPAPEAGSRRRTATTVAGTYRRPLQP
jgi:LPXTG-motif cell wall-anchored protein